MSRLAAVAALVVGLSWTVVPAAQAESTTYTWTADVGNPHGDHIHWGVAGNWSPEGVPGDGDSVVVQSVPGLSTTTILGIPTVTLQNLTVMGVADAPVRLGGDGGAITVGGAFTWTGGRISTDVAVAGAGAIEPGYDKDLWANLTTAGPLRLDSTAVAMSWTHRLHVLPTGSLVSAGTSRIDTDRCCGSAANVLVNDGTISVSGSLTATGLELRQQGALAVASGSVLTLTKGVGRLGPGATYSGSGTLAIDQTSAPDPDPEHPDASQGGLLAQGTNTLADGFRLALGTDTELTGASAFTGAGTMQWDGATIYGDLSLGKDIAVEVAGRPSRLGIWDIDVPGWHAAVKVSGHASVATGTELSIDDRALLDVERHAVLTVPGGAQVTSLTCCSTRPNLLTERGSELVLGGGGTQVTRLYDLHTELNGHTSVAPRATVSVEGGTFDQRGGVAVLGRRSQLELSDAAYRLTKGSLTGVGRLHGTLVNRHGTVDPGLSGKTGTLSVDVYRQGKHGILRVGVAGAKADRLNVKKSAKLGGVLKVKGGAQGHDRSHVVVKARHLSGRFATVRAKGWQVRYAGRTVVLDS